LYELATGEGAFDGKTPAQVTKSLSEPDREIKVMKVKDPRLKNLIKSCLRKDPQRRPSIHMVMMHTNPTCDENGTIDTCVCVWTKLLCVGYRILYIWHLDMFLKKVFSFNKLCFRLARESTLKRSNSGAHQFLFWYLHFLLCILGSMFVLNGSIWCSLTFLFTHDVACFKADLLIKFKTGPGTEPFVLMSHA
jgi:serine/threonine protein kinase